MLVYNKERQGYEVDYSRFNNTDLVDTPLCSARDLEHFYQLQQDLEQSASPNPGNLRNLLKSLLNSFSFSIKFLLEYGISNKYLIRLLSNSLICGILKKLLIIFSFKNNQTNFPSSQKTILFTTFRKFISSMKEVYYYSTQHRYQLSDSDCITW